MSTPYRTAPALVCMAPLPELRTDRCPGCGEEGLNFDGISRGGSFYSEARLVTVRPCSWWRRAWGCCEERPHVHCQMPAGGA